VNRTCERVRGWSKVSVCEGFSTRQDWRSWSSSAQTEDFIERMRRVFITFQTTLKQLRGNQAPEFRGTRVFQNKLG